MTRFGWTIVLAVLGVIALIAGFFIWRHMGTYQPQIDTQATTTSAVDPATLSIYTSGEYGFSLFYPLAARVTDAYSTTTLNGIPWRIGALGTGTPVVRLQESGEEIRIGVSTDQKDVKACVIAGPAESSQDTLTVGGIAWHVFTFQKVGTDNEQQVTSYRTMHGSSCYVLELFQALSGAATSTGYTLRDTITSFSFAH